MKTVSDKRRRQNVEFAKVRAWVLDRDHYRCQYTFFVDPRGLATCNDTPIDPHHVVTVARDKTLRLEPTNLITLCRRHHDWVHDHPAEATELGLLKSAGLGSVPPGDQK